MSCQDSSIDDHYAFGGVDTGHTRDLLPDSRHVDQVWSISAAVSRARVGQGTIAFLRAVKRLEQLLTANSSNVLLNPSVEDLAWESVALTCLICTALCKADT